VSKFVIIQGHPDPSQSRLNYALAERYAIAAAAAGHEVRRIDVGRMVFPMLRNAQDFMSEEVPAAIRNAQGDIAWADRIVFFYPLWIGDVPAALKAFLEQTFRPGFAMEYGGRRRFPKGRLKGKSARIVVTMGMPAFVYRTVFKAHSVENLRLNLRMCGVSPAQQTLIGGVEGASRRRRHGWMRLMETLAVRDGEPERRRNLVPTAIAASVLLGTCAYLSYVALTWARFGSSRSSDTTTLLDEVMPDYDVRLHHETKIAAPAEVAFDAMDRANVDGSPIVAALFRAREIIMRARHSDAPLPRGLRAQLESFGWRIVAERPGKELVFGAITQPWKANPRFEGLPAEQFARFHEPGYAKIAFTLRVDPLDAASSKAQTETRVQTTDVASRAKFRRYWAFLSPGMEVIRIVLLAQLKAEAERRADASWTPQPL
jgi:putative NADPH-quinone reductase